MARIDGTSSSWQGIVKMLAEIGLRVESPGEIAPLLTEHRDQLALKTAKAGQKAREQLKPIEEEIRIEKENIQNGPAERLSNLEEDIRQTKLHLELFRLDRSIVGRLSNQFRIRREEKKLRRLESNRDEITGRVERLLAEQDRILAEKRAAIEAEAAREYRDLNVKITTLQKVLDSKELADAVLELEMLEHFRALPDSARVLNGVRLEADSPVKLDGKAFWSAKIDHLVITPSGLFAIGVWRGGKPDPTEGDPVEQIRRAAHLCHELLKFDFPGITARAVLACRGHAPESSHAPYVKILPLNEVSGYINWFKDNSLGAEQVERVAEFLKDVNK